MNWHKNPELVDLLAGEYALGTLVGPARRRFERLMHQRQDVAMSVRRWHERLGPSLVPAKPIPPDPARWDALQARLFPAEAAAAKTAREPWWRRLLMPIPAGALAFGLMLGVLVGPIWEAMQQDAMLTQLPDSYVGVLATADGRPGLIVSSLRHGRTVDLKQLAPVSVPAGKTLYLWSIDAAGAVASVGPIPSGSFVSVALPAPAEAVFARAVELAVSIEALGAQPTEPSLPYVYRGLCGKLWLPPPAP
jgi:anti-sigma-K factor RskA